MSRISFVLLLAVFFSFGILRSQGLKKMTHCDPVLDIQFEEFGVKIMAEQVDTSTVFLDTISKYTYKIRLSSCRGDAHYVKRIDGQVIEEGSYKAPDQATTIVHYSVDPDVSETAVYVTIIRPVRTGIWRIWDEELGELKQVEYP